MDDSSVLEHGVILLDFSVGFQVGIDFFSAELEGHDSEYLSHVIGFVTLDLVGEQGTELLDGDDLVLLGFDLFDEFLEETGGSEELDGEILVVFKVSEDGFGIVLWDVLGILIGLIDSSSLSLGHLSLVQIAITLLVGSVVGLVLGVVRISKRWMRLHILLVVRLIDKIISSISNIIGTHLSNIVMTGIEILVDVVIGVGSDKCLSIRIFNLQNWLHIISKIILRLLW